MSKHPSVEYAEKCLKRGSIAPKYVKKQCKEFLRIVEGRDPDYMVDWKIVKKIDVILKLAIMPKGLKAGKTLYECSTGYQWMTYVASLAIVKKDNPKKRRYETVVLELARKSFKTFTVATVFILLFILEPPLSKFYSVAPDGSLSREVKEAISDTLRMSPALYEYAGEPRFKILRDYIEFKPTHSKYIPLNYSTSRMDGKYLPAITVM